MFSEAAHRLGFHVTLATDRCHVLDDPWGDHAIPVRFEDPDGAAVTLAAGTFDAVAAVGDRPAYIASLAAGLLGIPFHPPEAVAAARSKFLSRERFRAAGLPVPEYFRVKLAEDPAEVAARAQYPCVLKPLGLSASRGVIRADDQIQFLTAFDRIRRILSSVEIVRLDDDADTYLQVERYIPGPEFALEGLVTAGRLQVLALFDKPDPLEGPFFEETIYVTPSRQSQAVQSSIARAAQKAIHALGLRSGPVHTEMRCNEEGVWILEVAPRCIGGLCARSLVFQPRIPLEELILRHAAGEDVSGAQLRDGASGVMMIPIPRAGVYQSAQGVRDALEVPGIREVVITAKQGQMLQPLPEGGSYLGFLFAAGQTPHQAEEALRQAHGKLAFEILGALPVIGKAVAD
ncbi:MAG: ATP-grasp domain-containing protein [Acidobacteriia bacterium]|nr:ATP-grasp domain-containing protein [Terriglobia bacterium]